MHKVVHFFEQYEHFFVSVGTIGLFGVTAALFLATFLLWLATRKLVEDAKSTAKRQLRAYVVARNVAWRGGFDITQTVDGIQLIPKAQPLAVCSSLENFGQTPAKQVIFHAALQLLAHPLPRQQQLPPLPLLALQAPVSVWPKDPQAPVGWTQAPTAFTAQDLAQIGAGSMRIHFYGQITYRDIFDDEHVTTFRSFLDPASIQLSDGRPTFIWATAEEGNDFT